MAVTLCGARGKCPPMLSPAVSQGEQEQHRTAYIGGEAALIAGSLPFTKQNVRSGEG